jgi:hypothetical protein
VISKTLGRSRTGCNTLKLRSQFTPESLLYVLTLGADGEARDPGSRCQQHVEKQHIRKDVLSRLAIPKELAVLFAAVHRTGGMNKSTRADLSLPADQVGHDAEDLVGEVAIAEDVAFTETRCENRDDDWRLLGHWVALGEFAHTEEEQQFGNVVSGVGVSRYRRCFRSGSSYLSPILLACSEFNAEKSFSEFFSWNFAHM